MFIAEAVSDGGGASDVSSLALTYVPLTVSLIVLLVGIATYVLNVRKSAREHVWAYLQLLTSKETAQSRAIVAEAARVPIPRALAMTSRLRTSERQRGPQHEAERETIARYRDALFQMMWISALAPTALPPMNPVERCIVRNKIRAEQSQVYWHLGLVVDELANALDRWGGAFEWGESRRRVNDALDALPEEVPYINGRRMARPATRLRASSEEAS